MFRRLVQGSYVTNNNNGTLSASFTPDTGSRFVNPGAGPYNWSGSPTYLNNFTLANLNQIRSKTIPGTIVMALIDLSGYINADLDSTFLNNLSTRFGYIRSAGLMAIVRPVYNYSGSGTDAPLTRIKAHMAQFASLFEANKDVILLGQMGWAGQYGEFHDSSQGITDNAAQKLDLMQRWMANFPTELQIASRYPADSMTWFPNVLTQAQFDAALTSPTIQSRLALFDDGIASNGSAYGSNSGTYDGRPGSNSTTQAQKFAYAKALGPLTSAGGEVTTYAAPSPWRTSQSEALNEGIAYGYGYLNFETSSGPEIWSAYQSAGTDALIAKNYGARIQLDSLTYPISGYIRSTSVPFTVNLRNNGYARLIKSRQLVVSIRHVSTGETYSANLGELRRLAPNSGTSTAFSGSLAIPNAATAGNYAIFISAPDVHSSIASDVRYAWRFANASNGAQMWDASMGRWNTGVTVPVA